MRLSRRRPARSFDSRSAAARTSSLEPRASTGRSTLFGGAPTAEREWDNGNRDWNREFPRSRLSRRARFPRPAIGKRAETKRLVA